MDLQKLCKKFVKWAEYLHINSKDYGLIKFSLKRWWQSQKYLLKQIYQSDPEQRTFVVLKARQLGITSFINAFTLFYHQVIPNSKGAILVADYSDLDIIRRTIVHDFYDMIDEKYQVLLTSNSREGLRFANNSSLHFLYTSKRSTGQGKTGRGKAYNFLHATEVAYFNSWDDFHSLQQSLSDLHPARFYIYESTANGYNEFYDLYETAKKSPAMKAIFIGWWTKETYKLDPNSKTYQFFCYPLNREEKEWVEAVEKLYNFKITMPQMAWWRWKLYEAYNANKNYALQELPFFEDQAFQLSGNRFFDAALIKNLEDYLREETKMGLIKEKSYRLAYDGTNFVFQETTVKPNLLIWEFPDANAVYVIGADPTMAANPDSDNAVISVWRAEPEKVFQVAEFVDNQVSPQLFARFILLLAGLYNGAYINLEITGPGQSTLREIDYLRKMGWVPDVVLDSESKEYLQNNIRYIKEYLYCRADSLRKSYVRHWKTTPDTKVDLFHVMRGAIAENRVIIRSRELLKEMKTVIKDGAVIEAQSGFKDDRVIGAALAIETYMRFVRGRIDRIKSQQSRERKILRFGSVVIPIQ